MTLIPLPTVNAALNFTSAVFLTAGFIFIRRKNANAHRFCMSAAFLTSTLFLICYLYYHAHVGSKPFTGTGWIRPIYFSILLTHTILAAAIVPMIIVTLQRAFRNDFVRHARLARWTWPAWMYVSVTGVVIYWMLYH